MFHDSWLNPLFQGEFPCFSGFNPQQILGSPQGWKKPATPRPSELPNGRVQMSGHSSHVLACSKFHRAQMSPWSWRSPNSTLDALWGRKSPTQMDDNYGVPPYGMKGLHGTCFHEREGASRSRFGLQKIQSSGESHWHDSTIWGLPVMFGGLDSPHEYYSYVLNNSDFGVINQLSYRLGGTHCMGWFTKLVAG